MDLETAISISSDASERDPRKAPFGYFSGGSFVLDSVRVFMWFSTKEDLVDHIVRTDAAFFDLDDDESATYTRDANQLFSNDDGLSDENLALINKLSNSFRCIEWWGCFEELTHGDSEFAQGLRSSIREDESTVPIEENEMDEFIEYLLTCGC